MFDVRLTATQERWLADLYEAHAPAVQKLCWRLLANPQDAADACQEVFLRAAAHLDADLPRENARAWLLTVARNYCLDQIRRQKRHNTAMTRFGLDTPPETDPEASVADRDLVDVIFRQLSERERNVLWQTAVEHRPLAEIAGRLHLNYMAAGQVVSRARKRASMLAAKVAAIFLGFRFITRRVSGMPVKLMAAAVVPVAALSVQSSSSSTTSQPPHVAAQVAIAHPATAGGPARSSGTSTTGASSGLTLPSAAPLVSTPPLPAPSAVSGVAGTVTGTVKGIIPPLPSPPALPTPSLPPPPPLP
jgi:RNA polymerase sigma-70 factor, ECF subfamily